MSLARLITLSLLSLRLTSAQSTTYLPPPPLYEDGRFLSPDTSKTQIFSEGSTMNVTWSTKFPSINLYLLSGTDYNNPKTCLFGSTNTYWEWEVDDGGNNTLPFSFRIVNAEGTAEDLSGGGFYTGQFWIRSQNSDTTSAISTIEAAVTSSASTSSEVSSTKTSTSQGPASTSFNDAATSTSSTSSSTSSSSSSSPTFAPTASPNTTDDATSDPKDDQINTTAIGAGVGVGAGIVITALTFAIWILCRRNRRKNKQEQHHPNPQIMHDSKESSRLYEPYPSQHQHYQAQYRYQHEQRVYEFPSKSPVEVPSGQGQFSELAGSNVTTRAT